MLCGEAEDVTDGVDVLVGFHLEEEDNVAGVLVCVIPRRRPRGTENPGEENVARAEDQCQYCVCSLGPRCHTPAQGKPMSPTVM